MYVVAVVFTELDVGTTIVFVQCAVSTHHLFIYIFIPSHQFPTSQLEGADGI